MHTQDELKNGECLDDVVLGMKVVSGVYGERVVSGLLLRRDEMRFEQFEASPSESSGQSTSGRGFTERKRARAA